MITWRSFRY